MDNKFVRAYVLALLTIAVLSIAYYYVYALPKHNAERLQLDREKANKSGLFY